MQKPGSIIGSFDNLGRRKKQDNYLFGATSGGLNIAPAVGSRASISGGNEGASQTTDQPSSTTGIIVLGLIGLGALLLVSLA